MNVEQIARIAHEANRAYCETVGDDSQVPWAQAPEWQKESAICGVMATITSTGGPRHSHENWLAHKTAAGWIYGPIKNEKAKEHPCMVPYHLLPREQRAKDHLFQGVARSLFIAFEGRVEGMTAEQNAAIAMASHRFGRPVDSGLCT